MPAGKTHPLIISKFNTSSSHPVHNDGIGVLWVIEHEKSGIQKGGIVN